MTPKQAINSIVSQPDQADPTVSTAIEAVFATDRLPQSWADLSAALGGLGTKVSTRDLINAALEHAPTWKNARVASARLAAQDRDTALLGADLARLTESGVTPKVLEPLILRHAMLAQDMAALGPLIESHSEKVLSDPQAVPSRLLLNACCDADDMDTLKRMLDHAAKIDADRAPFPMCLRRLFGAGKPEQARALLAWVSDHPDLKARKSEALVASRLNLLKSNEYAVGAFEIAGLSPQTITEAQACVIDLTSPKTFAEGGEKIDQLLAIYDAILAGEVQSALEQIASFDGGDTFQSGVFEDLEILSGMLSKIINANAIQRPILSDVSQDDEITFGPIGSTEKTALIFSNLCFGNKFPLAMVDRLFAGAGYDCIFLEDRKVLSGSAGYEQLGPTAKASAAALRAELDARQCQNPLVVGASAGGLGSLNYGLTLNAEKIVVFSGGTVGSTEDMKALRDRRVAQFSSAFDAIDPVDNFKRPIRDVIADHPAPPPIMMVFSELNRGDRIQASTIEHFDNVELVPLPNTRRHRTIWPFLAEFGPQGLLD